MKNIVLSKKGQYVKILEKEPNKEDIYTIEFEDGVIIQNVSYEKFLNDELENPNSNKNTKTLTIKTKNKDMYYLNFLKKYYENQYGIILKDGSLIKQIIEDKAKDIIYCQKKE